MDNFDKCMFCMISGAIVGIIVIAVCITIYRIKIDALAISHGYTQVVLPGQNEADWVKDAGR